MRDRFVSYVQTNKQIWISLGKGYKTHEKMLSKLCSIVLLLLKMDFIVVQQSNFFLVLSVSIILAGQVSFLNCLLSNYLTLVDVKVTLTSKYT